MDVAFIWTEEKTVKKPVDEAMTHMEADLYTKLDEDGVKKMIYNMSRHMNEYTKDLKRGTFIKDRNVKLVTN